MARRVPDPEPEGPICEACQSQDLGGYCRSCGAQTERLNELLEDYRLKIRVLEKENTIKLMKIHRLQKEGDNRLRRHRRYADGVAVLEYWRDTCHPGAKEIESGERLKNVLDRLDHEYEVQELKRAAFGYSRFAYVVNGRRVSLGSPTQRRIDAELIYRDPGHVDQGLAMADEAERREQAIPDIKSEAQSAVLPTEDTPQLGNMGQAAVRLVEMGWHVFPLKPRDKVPATVNGFKDATVDKVRVVQFWLKHPDFNIGLRTGIESKLVVLDVDGQDGVESLRRLEDKYGSLPKTASIVTPRGGQHFYFRHPGSGEIQNTTGFPGPGLDLRGDGGYVVAPPSVGPNGRAYEVDEQVALAEMPIWLLKLLVERQTQLPLFGANPIEMVEKGVREGARNTQMASMVGSMIARGYTPDQAYSMARMANEARCAPPLSDRELAKVVESVVKMERRKAQRLLREMTQQAA